MKTFKTLILALMPLFSIAAPLNTITGAKKTSTEIINLNIEDVTSIDVCSAIDVTIVEGGADKNIEVELNENLWEYLYVTIEDGKLRIYLENGKGNLFRSVDASVKVPYNARLNSFEATAASSIRSEVDIIAPTLKVSADAASSVELTAIVEGDCRVKVDAASRVDLIAKMGGKCKVDVDAASRANLTISAVELEASIDAASKVMAEGRVNTLNVDAEAMSKFSGEKLECREGKLSAEAMSKIVYSSRGEGKFKISKEALSSVKNVK